MRQDSPLAAREAIRLEDLWQEPLITSRQAMRGGQLPNWLEISPEKLKVVATYNLLFNASLLVEAGLGHALCLDGIIPVTEDSVLCFRPLRPALKSHVALVWKKYQIFSKASELFLKRVRNDKALQ